MPMGETPSRMAPFRHCRLRPAISLRASSSEIFWKRGTLFPNSTDIYDANSKAISVWAYEPPYRPALDNMPMAPVASTHLEGDKANALSPAGFLNPSNSRG